MDKLTGTLKNGAGAARALQDVTPAEVALLRYLWGAEAVTDLAKSGTVSRTTTAEFDRLQLLYGDPPPEGVARTAFPCPLMKQVFGLRGAITMPTTLAALDTWQIAALAA